MYLNIQTFCLLVFITSSCLWNYGHCDKCPTGWLDFRRSCYKFSRSPRKAVIAAQESCRTYSANLVSVNSLEEHLFLSSWLKENDPQHLKWFTSGHDAGNNAWGWQGDKSTFANIHDLWIKYPDRSPSALVPGKHAAYNFSQYENRWGLIPTNEVEESAYVCEVNKEDLYHVLVTERNIDYGVTVFDKRYIPRGPVFTEEPKPAVFALSGRSQKNYISLRCVAAGYPTPTYEWFKEEYEISMVKSRHIDPLVDSRMTQTDGTLTIYSPQRTNDRGKYHCKASNQFGTIISETVQLSFGYIGEFNKKRSADHARENWGKSIACDPPQHHPRVNYFWTRNSFPNFVEEDRRVFTSYDGNLYFSAIEKIDRANYSCNVQSVISSTGRTGPFFSLVVDPGSSGQKLLFPNNFPKGFPEAPLAGDDVRLECIAYAYPVPSYNWTRLGVTSRLPDGAYTVSHNRVLMLPKVKVEDMGDYLCSASAGRDVISKPVTLSIQSLPVFTVPLSDKVVDRGVNLMWACEAFGIPEVTYKWFKNGKELDPFHLQNEAGGRYKIRENVLTIEGVTPGLDEGMFQCKASNTLGSKFSGGQLKIVSMRPSFKKHKLDAEMYASVGSNYTIPCLPEAIPFPQFAWKRNGQPITSGRARLLPNGFLYINPVDITDEGEYTCVARNEHGVDETRGSLTVFAKPRLVESPKPKVVGVVNDTMQLPCLAYTDNSLDIAYIWLHNGLRINYTRMPQFAPGTELGYLLLINITLAEAGEYKCLIKTSVGETFAKTEVIVHGPPSSPGAVLAEELTATSSKIQWSDGSENGRRILAYTIEGRTNHNPNWVVLAQFITTFLADSATGRRSAVVKDVLSPWSTYEFRVSAINELGQGLPSNPSPQYNTDKARPFRSPTNVGGGGGKAGTLTITWDPLPPQDWNAPEIWYVIYYRAYGSGSEFRAKELRSMGNIGMYTVNVGEENYFKKYEVKAQAKNPVDVGPASKEEEVYSAESMPQVQPSLVKGWPFNSTALNVSWAPVDSAREKLRGKLAGHRIKYWKNGHDPQIDSLTLLNRRNDSWGLIVALQPDTEYYVAVMAYNDAGSGPESEPFLARTYKAAPQRPPTSVKVKARDSTSVMVTWRGVAALTNAEEPIIGYKVRYWESDQPIAKARESFKYLDGGDLEAVISGLVPGKVYKLRVLAYSWGGDGKMSSPAWEFKVGEGSPSRYTSSGPASSLPYTQLLLVSNLVLIYNFLSRYFV